MIDRGGSGRATGERLLCCAEDPFHWRHRVRDGTLRRSTFRQYLSVVRAMTRDESEAGRVGSCARTAATCAELLKLEPALWAFARVEGIEPTNNAAERALRHAVRWRRASYGTDSEAGDRFVGNILSVVDTCRQQRHNVLEFLTACCRGPPPRQHSFQPPPGRKRLMESSFAQRTDTKPNPDFFRQRRPLYFPLRCFRRN